MASGTAIDGRERVCEVSHHLWLSFDWQVSIIFFRTHPFTNVIAVLNHAVVAQIWTGAQKVAHTGAGTAKLSLLRP